MRERKEGVPQSNDANLPHLASLISPLTSLLLLNSIYCHPWCCSSPLNLRLYSIWILLIQRIKAKTGRINKTERNSFTPNNASQQNPLSIPLTNISFTTTC